MKADNQNAPPNELMKWDENTSQSTPPHSQYNRGNEMSGDPSSRESSRQDLELSIPSSFGDLPFRGRGQGNQETTPAYNSPLGLTHPAVNPDTIDGYEHRIVRVEIWVLDRYGRMRGFEPVKGSEPIGQIFAYADKLRLRNDRQPFEGMKFSIMHNEDVVASTIIWRKDEEAQSALSQLINDNLDAIAETQRGSIIIINVNPMVFTIKC